VAARAASRSFSRPKARATLVAAAPEGSGRIASLA
jgi:hypothetical protein